MGPSFWNLVSSVGMLRSILLPTRRSTCRASLKSPSAATVGLTAFSAPMPCIYGRAWCRAGPRLLCARCRAGHRRAATWRTRTRLADGRAPPSAPAKRRRAEAQLKYCCLRCLLTMRHGRRGLERVVVLPGCRRSRPTPSSFGSHWITCGSVSFWCQSPRCCARWEGARCGGARAATCRAATRPARRRTLCGGSSFEVLARTRLAGAAAGGLVRRTRTSRRTSCPCSGWLPPSLRALRRLAAGTPDLEAAAAAPL